MSTDLMDIYEIERFCDRWIAKAQSYNTENLEDLFDRFFTLFVAYNRFYSSTAALHRANLNASKFIQFKGDRREATTFMAWAIKQARFSEIMRENPAISIACQNIANLLQRRCFFLHSIRNTREPDFIQDAKLADSLIKYRLQAVLECIYQIRCNIFHGEKEFIPRQADLLVPAITLLEAVIPLSRDALREAAL